MKLQPSSPPFPASCEQWSNQQKGEKKRKRKRQEWITHPPAKSQPCYYKKPPLQHPPFPGKLSQRKEIKKPKFAKMLLYFPNGKSAGSPDFASKSHKKSLLFLLCGIHHESMTRGRYEDMMMIVGGGIWLQSREGGRRRRESILDGRGGFLRAAKKATTSLEGKRLDIFQKFQRRTPQPAVVVFPVCHVKPILFCLFEGGSHIQVPPNSLKKLP